MSPGWLPRCVTAALVLQLTAAAGAVAGPWALTPAPVAVAAEPAAVLASAQETVVSAGPVLLSAPVLWAGVIALRPLSVDAAGSLEVPASAGELGWWSAGPRPGAEGAAVVVGHVDLDGQAGVFARLGAAARGTVVVVGRGADAVRYRVTRVDRYSKAAFPADEVYRPTAQSELLLITCGGRFDRSTGHYEDNLVVRAVRV